MTEIGAFGAFAAPDKVKVDFIGPAAPGATLKLADDGEILIRVPWAMRGYRNRPDATAEIFDDEGFVKTGDIGVIDKDGHLRIIDRKKDLIIGAGGKNMSPSNIEDKLINAGPLISQAAAIGNDRPYNVALLTLDSLAVLAWAEREGEGELGAPSENPKLMAAVQAEVDAANAAMSRVEQIKRFVVLDHEWLPGGPEMTPTMKLKRRSIDATYEDVVDALYAR